MPPRLTAFLVMRKLAQELEGRLLAALQLEREDAAGVVALRGVDPLLLLVLE